MVPGVTTQVATFQVVNSFGLFNSLWAPILLHMGTDIVSIYIFLQFIRGIPVSLDEAARLDGANSLTIYRKIILPLLKPAIATVVIIKGITVYSDFYIPFLYMPAEDLGTISTALFRFKGPFGAHWEHI
jgi:multiple sugar transport system permease protein